MTLWLIESIVDKIDEWKKKRRDKRKQKELKKITTEESVAKDVALVKSVVEGLGSQGSAVANSVSVKPVVKESVAEECEMC